MAKRTEIFKGAWILYLFYGAALAILLLYFMFPSGAVVDYVRLSAQKEVPGFYLEIAGALPCMGPGIVFRDVSFYRKSAPGLRLARFERIRLVPEILSLFREETVYRIEAEGLGGTVKGKFTPSDGGKKTAMSGNMEFLGIRLEDLKAVSEAAGRRVTGSLSGIISIASQGGDIISLSGLARLKAADAGLELVQPLVGITALRFSEITINGVLEKGRININQADFKGRELNGNLSGSISLAVPVEESILDIRGTVEPQVRFLTASDAAPEVKAAMIQFFKKGKIGFVLRGKIRSPTVRFM
ncbi:MAG: type II secretion system protein GspN [Deltaproteobacteria bacterium CG_4_8_14_3_um_filter_51_11]|nr:type II secretion system protein GspN [bacterium]OIP39086.1 MAG: type II secretion system protein GspN [Desulfobacteraceae bacterium CG2_30_51_40]PIX19148.1 MAG: type II secretion system protein GspN [Deltaproteobacteria bacterium CG_4_8_14_3_um_filter_51_11]